MIRHREAILLLTLSLADWSLVADCRAERTSPSRAERDSVLVGCELYLFGRRVDPIAHEGVTGIVVRRTATTVTINDVVFFDLNFKLVPVPLPDEVVEASKKRQHVVDQASEEVLQRISFTAEDSLLFDGRFPTYGEKQLLFTDEQGSPVYVELLRGSFRLSYQDELSIHRYRPRHYQKPTDDERLDDVYMTVVRRLAPGTLVIMGSGYAYMYHDPDGFNDLRIALALIPEHAKPPWGIDPYGGKIYEGVTIGEFRFGPSAVRDFVERMSAPANED